MTKEEINHCIRELLDEAEKTGIYIAAVVTDKDMETSTHFVGKAGHLVAALETAKYVILSRHTKIDGGPID